MYGSGKRLYTYGRTTKRYDNVIRFFFLFKPDRKITREFNRFDTLTAIHGAFRENNSAHVQKQIPIVHTRTVNR